MDLQMSGLQKQPPNGNFLGNKRKVRHVAGSDEKQVRLLRF